MATADVLSLIEAKDAIVTAQMDLSDDTTIAQYVTAVSQRLVDACGPIVYGTITAEVHDGGCSQIRLDKYPVASITTLTEYDFTTAQVLTAESNTSKTANDYLLNPVNGVITRRNSNTDSIFARGKRNIVCTYVAGRSADTASVDSKFKLAARYTLQNAWRGRLQSTGLVGEYDVPQANFPTFAIPNAAKQILAKEWQEGLGA